MEKENENESTAVKPTSNEATLAGMKGALVESLKRNSKQIRADRAIDIAESAEMRYKRTVEDMRNDMRKLERERDGMLDLSPTDKNSLILASDFKEEDFVKKDIEIGLEIRNLEITLKIAEERYKVLFGKEIPK